MMWNRGSQEGAGCSLSTVGTDLRLVRVISASVCLGALLTSLTGCMAFTYDDASGSEAEVVSTRTPMSTVAAPADMPTPTATGPRALRIEPSVMELSVGETRAAEIWLDNIQDLQSVELGIGFSSRCVRVEDADPDVAGTQIAEGDWLASAEVTKNEVDNDEGHITYRALLAEPASGSGLLASFTVRALCDSGSPLQFDAVDLRGVDDQALLTLDQAESGLVVIGASDVTPAAPADASPTEGTYHVVQRGENLFRIALRYGTTVSAIVAANNLPDESSVQAGQRLLIPSASYSTQAGGADYVVQPGDTLYSIARRFGTTVDTLAALNGIAPPYTIESGQRLIISP